MINKGLDNGEELKIQGLIDRYLNFRSKTGNNDREKSHLDNDLLTAFVEGKLSERESTATLKHLIDCSFCLHVTGELVKLTDALAEDETPINIADKQPTKVSEVLSGLLSSLFGTNDGAVFAHQEKEKDDLSSDEKEKKEKSL